MAKETTLEETTEIRGWKYWTEPSFIEVAGVETAYRRGGKGEPLVYLHGGGATRAWLPWHQELAKSFDVIAPEMPGYGDTKRPTDLDSWDDMVVHYARFFDAMGLEKFHLVGNSLGGWLAAKLAVLFPTKFTTVTLITPAGLRDEGDPFVDLFRLSADEEAEKLFNGRAEKYADQLVQWGDPEDSIVSYLESITSALLMWNPRFDRKLATHLPHMSAPTLVIGAEEDRLVGTGAAQVYANLCANSKLVRIKGNSGPSSHMVFMEQPEA